MNRRKDFGSGTSRKIMNIVITGASGFIGSVLLRKLVKEGQNVSVILRGESNFWRIEDLIPHIRVFRADLLNRQEITGVIRKIKPKIIYHLAAYGAYSYQQDADKIVNTNILGTWNLLQACNEIQYDLFVNTGSSSEYGFKRYAMRETDIVEPASYYAVTKCTQTLLCNHIAKQEKRPIVTFRPFSVYGPYEEPKRFIPALMNALYLKKEMRLVSQDTARDYIYVDDVVNAYRKIDELKKNPGEYFNIGSGIQSTVRDVVDAAEKVTGKTTAFKWGHMKNRMWDTDTWVADISKVKSRLTWTPEISLEEGLKKTWKWFQKNSRFYLRT
jgi:nucleoside-diphosphate-sugar epimerase